MRTPVVLSPHLDDAAISTYTILSAHPAPVVVNVFDGVPEPGTLTIWDRLCGATDSAVQAEARLTEDREALASFGIEPIGLGYRDALNRTPVEEPTIDMLLGEVAAALPDEPVIYAPLAGGPKPHPDHRIVRALAVELRDCGCEVWLYADLPYVVKSGSWPNWIAGTEGSGEVARWWWRMHREVPAVGFIDSPERIEKLNAAARRRKLTLMERYETQFDALNKKLRVRGLLVRPEIYGWEVFWRLEHPLGDLDS